MCIRDSVNSSEMMTGDFVKHRDANLRGRDRVAAIGQAIGDENLAAIDANALAEKLMGDTIYANVLMLGAAWQSGLVPVSLQALLRAIELNGVKVAENGRAFSWGRIAIADPAAIDGLSQDAEQTNDATLDDIIERRRLFLKDYQDDKLAERYVSLVEKVRTLEAGLSDGDNLTTAVARSYFKLLSYKDEYEVARLHTQTPFLASIREDFGRNAKLRFHLAPPFLNGGKDARGRPRKKEFGAWVLPAFRLLAKMRGLRGTAFDLFGRTAERRMERALIVEFEQLANEILPVVNAHNLDAASELVTCFMDIRGFGPVKEESVRLVREAVATRMRDLLGENRIAA